MSEQLPDLPLLAYRVLSGLEHQKIAVRWRSDDLERLRREMRGHHAATLAIAGGGALVISGTLLLLFGPGPILSMPLAQTLAIACLAGGGLLLTAGVWRQL
jgi:ubiquinone biosynthesis protein